MRIAMLGWEYPPHISGGLGTACEGLSGGLARYGVDILFVVPSLQGNEAAPHMLLVDSYGAVSKNGDGRPYSGISPVTDGFVNFEENPGEGSVEGVGEIGEIAELHNFPAPVQSGSFGADGPGIEGSKGKIRKRRIVSRLSPYARPLGDFISRISGNQTISSSELWELYQIARWGGAIGGSGNYLGDLFAEVERYAVRVLKLLEHEEFDAIHAHDWMTFPAGIALSRRSGKPLIVHVHSLEFDRSGAGRNAHIDHIEWLGLYYAQRVVAVSHYTKRLIIEQHKTPAEKISVVHNGIYPEQAVRRYRGGAWSSSRIVLFLGRITFQKGPDYFVEAAAKVAALVPDVKFVMAGSGDMSERLVNRVRELGLEANFEFPGFLKGQEVEEIFSLADVYVMPSVSEPFGIAALEAVKFDTPVILSKQSGVSEVLSHALKVDFWDIDRLAELIINALLYPEMRADMVNMAAAELRRLHWDASALKTIDVYRTVIG